jgi:ribonuclease III
VDVISLFGLSADSPRLEEALTHPSFAHEVRGQLDNQRLEFLGDAVLDFLTSRILFDRFPRADEGELTRRRALLVSTEALAHFARHHGLGQAIRFGRGAVMSSLEESDNVLADALEALLAATYLDHGLTAAEKACEKIVDHGIALAGGSAALDPKSELQRQVQAKGLRAPTYDVLRQEGPAHETIFEVVVLVEGREVGRGTGRSKKTAERAAAQNALDVREDEASGSLSDQVEGQA